MTTASFSAPGPKLLDRVRWHLRVKHYAIRTEQAYIDWIRRYILHHGKRHPSEMGEEEIAQFPYLSRRREECRRVHPKPGPQRSSLPLPAGARPKTRLHGQDRASQAPG